MQFVLPIIEKALSGTLKAKVDNGDAHWVTVKEGPLEGRHLLIDGVRPEKGGQSKGKILAGHGIPTHVIEKITGATHAHHVEHEQSEGPDKSEQGRPQREPKHKIGTKIHYTGDQANRSGTFEVDKVHHIEGKPYYDLKEVDGDRRFNRVHEVMIHDKKQAGTRFIPKDTHDTEMDRLRKEAQERDRKYLEQRRAERVTNEPKEKAKQEKPKVSGPFTEQDESRYNNMTHFPTTTDKLNQQHNEQVKLDHAQAMNQLKRYGVEEMPEDVKGGLKRLADAHEHFVREQIRSREVAPPWTVTGRANYRGRPDKADAIMRNASEKVDLAKKNLERTLNQYSPKRRVSSDDSDATQQLQSKIDEAEKMQEMYKKINSVARKKNLTDEQKVQVMVDLGLKESTAQAALKPDYMGNVGIPAYMLQNNNANIKRMKERIEQLQKNRNQSSGEFEFDGGKIHDNVDDNRVQIFFDDKPSREMIDKLKSRGFKWAPSIGAWQRMRSGEHVLDIAKQIVGDVNKSLSLMFVLRR